jgi:hypothetical protein
MWRASHVWILRTPHKRTDEAGGPQYLSRSVSVAALRDNRHDVFAKIQKALQAEHTPLDVVPRKPIRKFFAYELGESIFEHIPPAVRTTTLPGVSLYSQPTPGPRRMSSS